MLSDDLEKWAGEFNDENELKMRTRIGLNTVYNVLGSATIIVCAVQLYITGMPMFFLPVTKSVRQAAENKIAANYSDWDEDQRKNARAVVTILRRIKAI